MRPTVYHIPICPFCQRLEILLELKGLAHAVNFEVVDVTVPRSPHILQLTGGTTALPVMEIEPGVGLKESLRLMHVIEERFPDPHVQRLDSVERAAEARLVALEPGFVAAGYRLVMNRDPARRDDLVAEYLDGYVALDALLREFSRGSGPWLFDRFGWAETVFTPFFQRFVFVAYYEGVDLPADPRFDRVRVWRDACVAHPAAQQTSDEEVIKLYYDYSRGMGNGELVADRTRSSFAMEPHWSVRPFPPRGKPSVGVTDAELGLL